ncbi:MAG: putative sugar O-methyltransferase [Acidobacteria bacterium]|nr:putative sugar O-methyltransferase [Acidobacteriota bacterium]
MTEQRDAYETYLTVRDTVLRMKRHEGVRSAAPSAYWAEELSNIDYMIEASPLIVRKLRHHTFQLTGIRPYDYRVQDDGRRDAFERRLRALIELGGRDLLVPEHEALGGFGYRLAPGLFNLDTLKFFEVLVGMKRAGVLQSLEGLAPVVLEIGAGWGGFAYQVKTLFPRVSYLVIDFPELFLFSATYLHTVFPQARVVFADNASDPSGWRGADFVFVPNTAASCVRHVTPSVTVNIASFQEMTSAQVEEYAKLASDAGSRLLYSLNRERSRYNAQLWSVSELVGRYYDVREVALLDTDYTKAVKKLPKPWAVVDPRKNRDGEEDFAYRHLAGRRRAADAPQVAPPTASREAAATGALVGIGATLFNRAHYLREALDSLLTQTYRNFRLVLVDDASSDHTEAIAGEYAARDPRVRYVRHSERQGMVASWRHAFEEATAEASVRYFAWASDHDRWDPRWLETLVEAMEADPNLVLAYPFTRRLDADGRLLDKPPRLFETRGLTSLDERWLHVSREHVASGDMVYGLMRPEAVRDAGIFRDVMCPDRLLVAELALCGQFRQVPEELWFRRQFEEASVARQRTSLFAGRMPRGRWLPPWLQHGRTLWAVYVAGATDAVQRRAAARRVLRYSALYALKHQQKTTTYRQFGAILRGLTWTRKRVKHHVLLAVFHALVSTRRAYHRTVYEVAIFTRRIGLR